MNRHGVGGTFLLGRVRNGCVGGQRPLENILLFPQYYNGHYLAVKGRPLRSIQTAIHQF